MPDIAIVFRRPSSFYDYLLSQRAGKLIHAGIMLLDPYNPTNSVTYTTYMGETFSMSLTEKNSYNDKTEVAVLLHINDDEFNALTRYLDGMCHARIPYNYTDVACLMFPAIVTDPFLEEPATVSPQEIKKVYCSQSVVLALRNCLSDTRAFTYMLKHRNSRSILPMTLYYIIKDSGRHVSCNNLRTGVPTYIAPPADL
jgi:hypothetical protein